MLPMQAAEFVMFNINVRTARFLLFFWHYVSNYLLIIIIGYIVPHW
jgi:hypothetical protein